MVIVGGAPACLGLSPVTRAKVPLPSLRLLEAVQDWVLILRPPFGFPRLSLKVRLSVGHFTHPSRRVRDLRAMSPGG